ncbi:MAG: hypothetical protein KKE02_18135 [Alphaproteobacteria bacterium]|nr:hypothetical protein [Alphaproteobacteria bacterium]MBU1515220.1 hypothetical protein [Alphaproteobacteria bacterium]MBU2092350.1 hypothetical protein [Alphaproteobacteria bacterium]MBU2152944.1 hypothetical protein [Alphaproteobacteria bacterium]MBU2305775.1 hypothetical protein [Alphaproteobacteria bacterium]
MSKADTIDALMESAIHVFSRYGYEGASLFHAAPRRSGRVAPRRAD